MSVAAYTIVLTLLLTFYMPKARFLKSNWLRLGAMVIICENRTINACELLTNVFNKIDVVNGNLVGMVYLHYLADGGNYGARLVEGLIFEELTIFNVHKVVFKHWERTLWSLPILLALEKFIYGGKLQMGLPLSLESLFYHSHV